LDHGWEREGQGRGVLGENQPLTVIFCLRNRVRKSFQRKPKLEKIGKGVETRMPRFQADKQFDKTKQN